MIHPTGLALFGEFNITNNYNLSMGVKALAVSLGIRVRDDFITEIDFTRLTVGKVLSSNISSTESDIVNFIFGKSLSSQFLQEDQTTFLVTKNLLNESSVEDSLNFEYSTIVSSEQQFADQLSLNVARILDTEVFLEDNIVVSVVFEEDLTSSVDNLDDNISLTIGKEVSSEFELNDQISVLPLYGLESSVSVEESLTYNLETNLSLVEVSVEEDISLETAKYEEDTLQDQQHQGYVQLNPYYGEDYVSFDDTYSQGSRTRIFPSDGILPLEGDLMLQDGEEDLQTLDGEVDLNV
jgi:hypothetical protein